MTENYGADVSDWDFLTLMLGLTKDLLPVVSNPSATISQRSTLRSLGKVPSVYDSRRDVVGLAKWTARVTSDADVEKWMGEPDYGICIQTRLVRAIDVDIEDSAVVEEICREIEEIVDLPLRWRGNSEKILLAFILPGEFSKRIIRTKDGIIEFLANGQQFIAHGTHPSRVKYEWAGLEDGIPEITLEQFEKIWQMLVEKYAIEPPVTLGGVRRGPNGVVTHNDPVLAHLPILSFGKEGQAYIECPFADQHSADSSPTATVYFPAGGRGYEQGHFKCLHAHCAGRTDVEFLDAFGVRIAEFEVLDTPAEAGIAASGESAPELLPVLKRDGNGAINATIGNVRIILSDARLCGDYIRFDTFRDEILFAPVDDPTGWRAFRDCDYVRLREKLEAEGFKPISHEMIRHAVLRVSDMNKFDTAVVWLEGIEWDGIKRVEKSLSSYFGVNDSEYSRAVSMYMWSALAGRVLEPGVKADMLPVLVGAQGIGKSFGVAELVPSVDFSETITLGGRDADVARRMRGKLVIEIGELVGLHAREVESVKEFISRTHESWVPKYQEFACKYARRFLFIGTTNQHEFLSDSTGNRRWLPVRCGAVDVAAVRRDRLQLWAEGREIFKKHGIVWESAEILAKDVHEEHRIGDAWVESISTWLETPNDMDGCTPVVKGHITTKEVALEVLQMDPHRLRKCDEMRIGNILHELGFTRMLLRVGKNVQRVWSKT